MRAYVNNKRRKAHRRGKAKRSRAPGVTNEGDWGECESCGQHLPLNTETGMCGPCTFGEADTLMCPNG